MKKIFNSLLLLLILASSFSFVEDWGFFAHRRINRLAVFTLPPAVLIFYKKNIEYITEHAVDPDKRRYASRHEAVRHYIDIDHWGTYPFPEVPRKWTDALIKYSELYYLNSAGDTMQLIGNASLKEEGDLFVLGDSIQENPFLADLSLTRKQYKDFFFQEILPQYYEEEWPLDCDKLSALLGQEMDCKSAFAVDRFSEYGILPFHLVKMQSRLTKAFQNHDVKRILQLSAEFGHYIGDAHVPLHTTVNYNGQLTDQVGIHAFWESRIPELFADKEYDFFVGKARYIKDPSDYYWDIVLTSHSYVDSVLLIEKELSKTFPQDKQYCYDQRLESSVRTQCRAYAQAYRKRMDGMVEARMRASVLAIGDAWYTAWVDAGQPDMKNLNAERVKDALAKEAESLNNSYRQEPAKGRNHGQ